MQGRTQSDILPSAQASYLEVPYLAPLWVFQEGVGVAMTPPIAVTMNLHSLVLWLRAAAMIAGRLEPGVLTEEEQLALRHAIDQALVLADREAA